MLTTLLGLASLDPLTSVGVVLAGLFVGLSWLTRRLQSPGLPAGSRSERSFTLTGQHAVHVIEIGNERLLVGTGPSGAPRLLAELGPAQAEAEVSGGERPGWVEGLRSLGAALTMRGGRGQGGR
ncbi:flagellar biosynthetic protein FliO [Pseudenhygromyxa sp. WMMC2535]|uniref:flagellar biosynthetic protein FliO n=1 Tax=Pseudenhygromyxa sp. WMMC2535 TaxID=2712867 RepID=UPI001552DDAC|nr:flagellar biosynthetic protein FliO [Pseudenhygromyxa sp. WMMC2535]NVB36796.1 flagellar biosynthetic protein FliO [Pseudenhygromyxa sp. WMMC2535]